MCLFCQLADLDGEFTLSNHRADFMNIHLIWFLLKQNGPEALPRAVPNFSERQRAVYFRIPSLEITSR